MKNELYHEHVLKEIINPLSWLEGSAVFWLLYLNMLHLKVQSVEEDLKDTSVKILQ